MYSIGQVEEITGVKAHVLRYWEEIIPGFAPQKDIGGRRIYSQRELELVMRLKFLIYEKKFTIEGARDQLIAEVDSVNDNADVIRQISELRKDLTDLYFEIKNLQKK
ncbi:MAG: MerR family transcriptional regulator [Treponema sp.]|jgi:DNA-binding transcriptional MerR regulator|nr:MerR family transcriptional regulator [Treponema sp.]